MWRRTVNGRAVPVDTEPHAHGNLDDDGEVVRVVRQASRPGLYRSHFATCGQAAQHRKPRAPTKKRGPADCEHCGEPCEQFEGRCGTCGHALCGQRCAYQHERQCARAASRG